MSIDVMSTVWRQSKQKGSALLLLLSLADYADEKGVAFPSVDTLAGKVRMTPRNVQLLLRKLEADGEIVIKANAGPGGANRYRLTFQGGEKFSSQNGTDNGGGGEIQREGGEIQRAKGVKPASPDPSLDPPVQQGQGEAAEPPAPPATPPSVAIALDGETATAEPDPTTPRAMTEQPVIVAYRAVFQRFPSRAQMVQLLQHGISDLPRWERALTSWLMAGYNPLNIGGMFDWYDHPERIAGSLGIFNATNTTRGTDGNRTSHTNTASTPGRSAQPDSRPPWANYRSVEFNPILAAELNGDAPYAA
jgi:hypothetical protein